MKIERVGNTFTTKIKPIHVNDIKQFKFFRAEDKIVKYAKCTILRHIVNLTQNEADKFSLENPDYNRGYTFIPDFIRNLSIRFKDEDKHSKAVNCGKAMWIIAGNYEPYYNWRYDDACRPIIPLRISIFFTFTVHNNYFNEPLDNEELIVSYEAGYLPMNITSYMITSFTIKSDDTQGQLLTFKGGCIGKRTSSDEYLDDYTDLPRDFENMYESDKLMYKDFRSYSFSTICQLQNEHYKTGFACAVQPEVVFNPRIKNILDYEYKLEEISERIMPKHILIEDVLKVTVSGHSILESSDSFPYNHPDYPQNKGVYITNPPQMEFIIMKKDLENTEAWCRDLGFTFYVQGIYKTEYTEESIDKSYSSFCKMLEVYKSISPYCNEDEIPNKRKYSEMVMNG